VAVGLEIDKRVSMPTKLPPHEPEYHLNVSPFPPVAVNVIFPPALAQKIFTSTLAAVGALTSEYFTKE